MFVDSHCHLDFPDYDPDRDATVQRARDAGVGRFLTICTRLRGAEKIVQLAAGYPDVFASIGTHPDHATEERDLGQGMLRELAGNPKVAAIGECGLDYHNNESTREDQETVFRDHIHVAADTGLPLVIHTREAEADTIRILRDEPQASGVFHCFTSSISLARQALELGYMISFSGIVTFKNAVDLREVVRMVPLDRLLVETDAPFLAPVPYRGKRNEPAYVLHTAEIVAGLKGVTLKELGERTTENFFDLFPRGCLMRVTILGCGGSMGIPNIAGGWGKCDPVNPRNRRQRTSILMEYGGRTVLIDAGPDLKPQMLAAGVIQVDGVLITHSHADHTQGLDDLRGLVHKDRGPLNLYATAETMEDLDRRFGYIFRPRKLPGYTQPPFLKARQISIPCRIEELDLQCFDQDHFDCRSVGVRTGGFAYSPDVAQLDEAAFAALEGVDTWIIAALSYQGNAAHASVDQVLEWVQRVSPRRAVLTHLGSSLDYQTLSEKLPAGVEAAYDGMVIEVQDQADD